MSRSTFRIIASLSCALVAGGCGGEVESDRLPIYPARGTVTVNGLPALGVLVLLHPKEGTVAAREGAIPSATTDADGTFRLSTYEQGDGAPAGEYAVTVQWYLSASADSKGPGQIPGFARPTDRFHGKYRDPKKSPWVVTITEGENVLKPIEVE